MGYGVNLQKWHGWLSVFLGFALGIIVGFNLNDMAFGLLAAFFCAGSLLLFGPLMLRRRKM
jgi:uncharacterized membrane protein HdeD (DUF308 family)